MPAPLRPAVFFDRDGVINVDHGYIDRVERFDLVAGAAQAVRACNDAGFLVFIVTNQSGIARGYFDESALQAIHAHMRALLARDGARIDDLRFCPHHVNAVVPRYRKACSWRKPEPGMILDLLHDWRVDAARSFLVGDKDSDLAAAAAAGIAGHLFVGGNMLDFVAPILHVATTVA